MPPKDRNPPAPSGNKPDGYDVLVLKVAQLEEQMKNDVMCPDTGHAGRITKMEHRWTGILWLWSAAVIVGPILIFASQRIIVGEQREMERRIVHQVKESVR